MVEKYVFCVFFYLICLILDALRDFVLLCSFYVLRQLLTYSEQTKKNQSEFLRERSRNVYVKLGNIPTFMNKSSR